MSSFIGLITSPAKTSPVASNCKVSQEGNQIVLTDDTSTRTFAQKQEFSEITTKFSSVIDRVSPSGSMRVISFGSEFSTPTIPQIKEWSIQFINQRFAANSAVAGVPISAGVVFDKDVLDFFALSNGKTERFEMMEVDSLYDAIDLIDYSFEKFKRFKESVYVLHVGEEPFFEWVVVPRVDSFVPTPSLAGLPPNEKLIFILKQFPSLQEKGVDRFRRMSNVFRLVSDTFSDIPTLWVCHIAKDVTLKSNAALFRIVNYISEATKLHLSTSNRSELFFLSSKEENIENTESERDAMSEKTIINEDQRQEAELEEKLLKRELKIRYSDDDSDIEPDSDDEDLEQLQIDANEVEGGKGKKGQGIGGQGIGIGGQGIGIGGQGSKLGGKGSAARGGKRGGKSPLNNKGRGQNGDEDDELAAQFEGGDNSSYVEEGDEEGSLMNKNKSSSKSNKQQKNLKKSPRKGGAAGDDNEVDENEVDASAEGGEEGRGDEGVGEEGRSGKKGRGRGGSASKRGTRGGKGKGSKRGRKGGADNDQDQNEAYDEDGDADSPIVMLDASGAVNTDDIEPDENPEELERLKKRQELAKAEEENLAALKAGIKKPKKKRRKNATGKEGDENENEENKNDQEGKEGKDSQQDPLDEATKQRIAELREQRRKKQLEKEQKEKEKKKKLQEEASAAPTGSTMSKRDRITRRMQQLRAMRMQEESEYEEEEEDEDEINTLLNDKKKKKLSPGEIRQKNFFNIQLLVMKARRIANDPESTKTDMIKVDNEMLSYLGDVDEKRSQTEKEIISLRKKLAQKKALHEENIKDMKVFRSEYLELHNKNVQEKAAKSLKKRLEQNKNGNELNRNSKRPEYLRAKMLLEKEIENVKKEIKSIKRRQTVQA